MKQILKLLWINLLGTLSNERGGGSPSVSAPATPPQPTGAEAVNAWTENLPQIYQTQLQYEPLLMQQQLEMQQAYSEPLLQQYLQGQQQYGTEMAKQQMELQKEYAPQMLQQQYEAQLQYAPELAQAQYDISKQLYPETVGLQENMAKQASEGMQSGVPSWMRDQYQSDLRANIGTNAGSGIGADYTSRGLLEQQQNWQQYYQNLGLSLTGRQPLTQPSTVNTPTVNQPQYNMPQYQGTNWTSSFTPNTTWGNMNTGYGNYSNAYSSMYGANAQLAGQGDPMMNALMGGLGTGAGMMLGKSSIRYKTNIKLWA